MAVFFFVGDAIGDATSRHAVSTSCWYTEDDQEIVIIPVHWLSLKLHHAQATGVFIGLLGILWKVSVKEEIDCKAGSRDWRTGPRARRSSAHTFQTEIWNIQGKKQFSECKTLTHEYNTSCNFSCTLHPSTTVIRTNTLAAHCLVWQILNYNLCCWDLFKCQLNSLPEILKFIIHHSWSLL